MSQERTPFIGPILGAIGKAIMTNGTLTALGTGLATAGAGYISQTATNRQVNRGALQRQALANKENFNFWKMQNAYNTPSSQMARLTAAGLNPALIYGSGQTNTGVAGSIAPSKAAPYNVKNPFSPTDMLIQAQMAKIQAETDNQKIKNRLLEGTLDSDIAIRANKAIQEQIKASTLKQAQKDVLIEFAQKAIQAVEKTGEMKSEFEYFQDLRASGIDPKGPAATNVIKIIHQTGKKVIEYLDID
jgi:hypothetical protein